ncbi:MAG: phosphate acyltransferase [Verrucomicrobia bacterium]|nr:phosphate acyltransferase [Verrucomicrobiota bacterium]
MLRFIETVYENLKRHPKRVVFPEGTEPAVVRAAGRFAKLGLGTPVLLGQRDVVEKVAKSARVNLDHIGIVDTAKSSELEAFIPRLEKLKRYRDMGSKQAREILSQPNYFAAMMVQYNLVDALVVGAGLTPASTLRPLIQVIQPLPGISTVSSCQMLDLSNKRYGERGVIFFADCAVIPEPTVDQLANIAIETGKICRQLTGNKPRVAFLSFSNKGASQIPAVQKMAAATALAKQRAHEAGLEMEIDGEMQADTAIVPGLAAIKAHDSLVAGKANVLIFPDLNSANIASKLVKHLAGADVYGQFLLGLSRPCVDLSRGATDDEILGVAATAGLLAIQYRELYPERVAG